MLQSRVKEWQIRWKKNKGLRYAAYKRSTLGGKWHIWIKSEGWIKLYHANSSGKKERLAILIWGKINFEIETIKKDKLGHYIMMKGSIQEDITLVNIYTPNIGASEYIKQILTDIKGEIDGNTITVANFSTIFTSMERSSRQKINDTLQQI